MGNIKKTIKIEHKELFLFFHSGFLLRGKKCESIISRTKLQSKDKTVKLIKFRMLKQS